MWNYLLKGIIKRNKPQFSLNVQTDIEKLNTFHEISFLIRIIFEDLWGLKNGLNKRQNDHHLRMGCDTPNLRPLL